MKYAATHYTLIPLEDHFSRVDSKYDSISERFQRSLFAGLNGLGNSGRFFRAIKVGFEIFKSSLTSALVKYFSSSILITKLNRMCTKYHLLKQSSIMFIKIKKRVKFGNFYLKKVLTPSINCG